MNAAHRGPRGLGIDVDTRGATLVEYLVLVGLVACLCVAGFRSFGRSVLDVSTRQADCVADLAGCEPGDSPFTGRRTRDETGTVTLTRAPTVNVPPGDAEIIDDGTVLQVDSSEFPTPVETPRDVLRYVLGSKLEQNQADLQSFLVQDPTQPVSPRVAPALDAFAALKGASPNEPVTRKKFQKFVRDYQAVVQRSRAEPTSSEVIDEVLSTDETTPPTGDLAEGQLWIRADGIMFDGTEGEQALRLAARQSSLEGVPFTDQEIDYALAALRPVRLVHYDSDDSEQARWLQGDDVTAESLAAQLEKGDGARRVGSMIFMKYTPSVTSLEVLAVARLAISEGYPDIQSYVAAKLASDPKGFTDYVVEVLTGGLWDGAAMDVYGIYEIVTDIPGTATALWELARIGAQSSPVIVSGYTVYPNPLYDPQQAEKGGRLASEVWKEIAEYCTSTPARCTGRTIYEIVTLVVAPAKILKVAKVKWLAKLAKGAEKTADVLETTTDLNKAVKTADKTAEVVDTVQTTEKIADKTKTVEKVADEVKTIQNVVDKTRTVRRIGDQVQNKTRRVVAETKTKTKSPTKVLDDVKSSDAIVDRTRYLGRLEDFVPDGSLGPTFAPGDLFGKGMISPIPVTPGTGPAKVIKIVGTDEDLAKWISEFDGFPAGTTTVVTHGDTFTALLKRGGVNSELSQRDLMTYIAKNGGPGNGPILLMACKTGDATRTWPFAQNLANKLGREVWAPTEEIVFGSEKATGRKAFIIGTKLPDGSFREGSWRRFVPKEPGLPP